MHRQVTTGTWARWSDLRLHLDRCLTVSATWNTADYSQKVVGLYRADSEAQLDGLLVALPLSGWMHIRRQR
jgi:hypothetical protein